MIKETTVDCVVTINAFGWECLLMLLNWAECRLVERKSF